MRHGRGLDADGRAGKRRRVAVEKPVNAVAERERDDALQRFTQKIFFRAQPRALREQQRLAVDRKPAEPGDRAGHGERERAAPRQRADALAVLDAPQSAATYLPWLKAAFIFLLVGWCIEEMERKLAVAMQSVLNISATVKLVEPKSLARSEGKAKRVIDNRRI